MLLPLQSYPLQDGKADGTETTSNLNQKLYFHRLGTEQKEDVLVAEIPEHPKWMMQVFHFYFIVDEMSF